MDGTAQHILAALSKQRLLRKQPVTLGSENERLEFIGPYNYDGGEYHGTPPLGAIFKVQRLVSTARKSTSAEKTVALLNRSRHELAENLALGIGTLFRCGTIEL